MNVHRYLNQHMLSIGDWSTHQEAVKHLFDTALEIMPLRNCAMILGSGNCRDIPLDILTDQFESVVLVDIDSETSERVSLKNSKISYIKCDLSGLLDWINTLPTLSPITPPNIQNNDTGLAQHVIPPPLIPWLGHCDLVVSIGVASQLITPLLATKYGSQKIWSMEPWAKIIIEVALKHYQLVEQLLQPKGIGIIGTEVLTSERVPYSDLALFTETVADSTKDITGAIRKFPDATLKVGIALYLEYLKKRSSLPSFQWPWLFDKNRLYQMTGWLVDPARDTQD